MVLEDHLKMFNTVINVGTSVELKCDIRGATDILWKRSGVDLSKLESKDIKVSLPLFYSMKYFGLLYLT